MRGFIVPMLAFGLAAGCAETPAGIESAAAQLTQAGTSGCFAVAGTISQLGAFPNFSGTISGDIEGTVSTQLDPASARVRGVVNFSEGIQTWEVTGGSVTPLIGRTVHLALDAEVPFAQFPENRNNTRARVIDGAESGHLTYHGTLLIIPPPPFVTEVQYRGVICP